MRTTLVGVLAVGVAAALPGIARAQTAATVREIERVVKTGRAGSTALTNARIGAALGVGDRVRTGGRSSAGLRFADQSLLRVGELSEVVITNARQRQAQVNRGKVFADYKAPGTISGGYAVAAVRGTRVLFDEKGKEDVVSNFRGRTFVAGKGNDLAAGSGAAVTPTTLTDPLLMESSIDWTGGQVRFVDGPYAGQVRPISRFVAASGQVTFEPPLQAPGAGAPGGATGYLLVRRPERLVVELRDNYGTTVREGQDPTPPYRIPHEEFAGLYHYPWFHEGASVQYAYPGTRAHQVDQENEWSIREAMAKAVTAGLEGCDCGGTPLPPGGFGAAALGARAAARSAFRQDVSHLALARASAMGTGLPSGGSPRLEDIRLPANVQETSSRDEMVGVLLEPFGIGSTDLDRVGFRVRGQGTSGQAYAELGYRYARNNWHRDDHDVSEGFVHFRTKSGDIIGGRQHLFYGPANNTDISTLLGLEATDAIVYALPLKKGLEQKLGYIFDSKALRKGGLEGGFIRGTAPFNGGYLGYNVLIPTDGRKQIGASGEISQPVIRNVLDVYGEGGVGQSGRMIVTGGLYLPAIYQAYKVDFFAEYANKEDLREVVTFRLRREFGNGLQLQLFANRELGGTGSWNLGGGGVWSIRFR